MHFCSKCQNMYYISIDPNNANSLIYYCRNCGNSDDTLSVENVGFSPKDMMYNEASQYLATEIARAMNVPAYYISADMNNSMTYQNIIVDMT